MRLKTYAAPTVSQAMAMIRRELGPDAIIVSTHAGRGGRDARVTAAVDHSIDAGSRWDGPPAARAGAERGSSRDGRRAIPEAIIDRLRFHGVPSALASELVVAADPFADEGSELALSAAIDATIAFSAISAIERRRPLMLVGPAGAGKTLTAAKLLTRARQSGATAAAITTDGARAGAVEQLDAFARLLGVPLATAADPAALATVIAGSPPVFRVIDAAGCNPFDDAEVDHLRDLIDAADAEPVAVLAAGGDPLESAEIAERLASLGCLRLIVTRVDAARRLGAILSAPEASGMALAAVGVGPHVAGGLSPINPVALARLLLSQEAAVPSPLLEPAETT